MTSPPMWSIGKSKRSKLQASCSPAPNELELKKENKFFQEISIRFQFSQYLIESRNNPGPGEYSPNLTTINSMQSPRYPFGIRLKKVMASNQVTPGVGSYNPVKTTEIWSKFSFSYKPDPDQVPKAVGPADYKPNIKPTIRHSPSCQFGSSSRDQKPRIINPSPDQYTPNTALIRSPQFTFSKTARHSSVTFTTPGPGSYEHKSTLSNKMITMISRRQVSQQSRNMKNPAPTSYNPQQYYEFCGVPSSVIGTQERIAFMERQDNPGPGEYEFTDSNKPGIRKSKFPNSKRTPLQQAGVLTPGPGQYEIKSFTTEGPTHIIAKKLYYDFSEKFPGPGHYDPEFQVFSQRSQEPIIGTALRPELHLKTESPGPGTYHIQKNMDGTKIGIGNAFRLSEFKDETPGPGEYDIPVQIANVPLYALPRETIKHSII